MINEKFEVMELNEMTNRVIEHLEETAKRDYELNGDPQERLQNYVLCRGTVTKILKLKKQIRPQEFNPLMEALAKRYRVKKQTGGFYNVKVLAAVEVPKKAWTKVNRTTIN